MFLDRRRWLHQAGMGLGLLGVGSLLEAEGASQTGPAARGLATPSTASKACDPHLF